MGWSEWAAGVLAGIGAPQTNGNVDTLWAWSNAESGADVMRWNNPLNTTQELIRGVDPDMNSVGVESYATVQDGVTATVATLLNGRYPTIVAHLRNSIPRVKWGDACAELGVWGTGCSWLNAFYGDASGQIAQEDDLSAEDTANINEVLSIVNGKHLNGPSIDELAVANGTAIADVKAEVADVKAQVEKLVAALIPAPAPDAPVDVAQHAGELSTEGANTPA